MKCCIVGGAQPLMRLITAVVNCHQAQVGKSGARLAARVVALRADPKEVLKAHTPEGVARAAGKLKFPPIGSGG